MPGPEYFKSPDQFRTWLGKHHLTAAELWVGFHKKATGKPSMTWPQSVDQALCFGWIDGIRKSVDEVRYTIRFTPRKQRSVWSAINIRRAKELSKLGLMQPQGLKCFAARLENRSGIYSYEQRRDQLDEPYAAKMRSSPKALVFYEKQPASYRRAVNWWVVSAKQESTRLRRLGTLIDCSRKGRRVPQFTRTPMK